MLVFVVVAAVAVVVVAAVCCCRSRFDFVPSLDAFRLAASSLSFRLAASNQMLRYRTPSPHTPSSRDGGNSSCDCSMCAGRGEFGVGSDMDDVDGYEATKRVRGVPNWV